MLKVIKVVRILTTFLFLIILSFSYAFLPLTIDINIEEIGRISKDLYFYSSVTLLLLIQLITYFLRYYMDRENVAFNLKVAIHSLTPILFFSIILLLGFITFYNNQESFPSGSYNYLYYLSGGLVLVWVVGFIYTIINR